MKKRGPLAVLLSLSAALTTLHCTEHLLHMGRSVGGGGQIEAAEDRSPGDLFGRRCSTCHPNGGNEIRPDLPLIKSPQLEDFNAFLGYVRTPRPRDGSMNIMPPISADDLSNEEAREIYEGILQMTR